MRGGSAPIDPASMEKPYNRHPMVKRFLVDGEQVTTGLNLAHKDSLLPFHDKHLSCVPVLGSE